MGADSASNTNTVYWRLDQWIETDFQFSMPSRRRPAYRYIKFCNCSHTGKQCTVVFRINDRRRYI